MISDQVAERLVAGGHDCVAVTATPDLRQLEDAEVFARAQSEGRAVVTYNVADFQPIVQKYALAEREHHGVIFISNVRIPQGDLARLTAALEKLLNSFQPWPSFVTWLLE